MLSIPFHLKETPINYFEVTDAIVSANTNQSRIQCDIDKEADFHEIANKLILFEIKVEQFTTGTTKDFVNSCVTVDDIHELFGLRSCITKYLCDNCSIEMPMRSHDQSKGFAFITAPQHLTKELVKLNGVQFKGNCLIVEE